MPYPPDSHTGLMPNHDVSGGSPSGPAATEPAAAPDQSQSSGVFSQSRLAERRPTVSHLADPAAALLPYPTAGLDERSRDPILAPLIPHQPAHLPRIRDVTRSTRSRPDATDPLIHSSLASPDTDSATRRRSRRRLDHGTLQLPGRSIFPGPLIAPNSPVHIPSLISPSVVDEQEDSRRSKRRKLDGEAHPESHSAGYGKYGQVKPGRLKMEIVRCNGGGPEADLALSAGNLLKDDLSLFCAKSNRASILLRHQGGNVFNLREIIIKTPCYALDESTIYDCHGLVFMTLKDGDELNRTHNYQIQYEPGPPDPLPRVRPNVDHFEQDPHSTLFFGDYFSRRLDHHHPLYLTPASPTLPWTDPGARNSSIPQPLDAGERDNNAGLDNLDHDHGDDDDDDEDDDDEEDDEDDDEEEDEGNYDIALNHAHVPDAFKVIDSGYKVTIESSLEAPPSGTFRPRYIGRFGSLRYDSFAEDGRSPLQAHYDTFEDIAQRRIERNRLNSLNSLGSSEIIDRHTPRLYCPSRSATEAPLLRPVARFVMRKDNNVCTIKFDPPAAARFVLIKIWNLVEAVPNIDLQAIVVKGYSGPRFVPAQQMS